MYLCKVFTGKSSDIVNTTSLSEEILIGRLKSGEKEAYRELLGLYSDRVFNTSLGLLQNHEDAEDIAQEVFIEVYRSVSGFRGQSKLSTWIYRIAVTKSLELIRSRQRDKRSGIILSLFGKEQTISVTRDEPFFHPGVKLENKEMVAVLFAAIRRLPENQRIAFTLNKLEDLSYSEIAEVMKVSVSSVESLLFRAKQKLRELLGEYYEQNFR